MRNRTRRWFLKLGAALGPALLALTGCGGLESEAHVAAGEPVTQDAQSALIARAAELELRALLERDNLWRMR